MKNLMKHKPGVNSLNMKFLNRFFKCVAFHLLSCSRSGSCPLAVPMANCSMQEIVNLPFKWLHDFGKGSGACSFNFQAFLCTQLLTNFQGGLQSQPETLLPLLYDKTH